LNAKLAVHRPLLTGPDRAGVVLKKISEDTGETVQEIDREKHKHWVVVRFFGLTDGVNRFRCLLPVKWAGKPLPSICAGDYYALHILQTLLGNETVELAFQNCEGQECEDDGNGNAIFLCAPQANPALEKHAHALILKGGRTDDMPRFYGMVIPCWFADDGPNPGRDTDSAIKKIWIPSVNTVLESGAEEEHQRAAPGIRHKPRDPIQSDYAILLRMSVPRKRKLFVIAGIHQYGTWIAAEFLNRLAMKYSYNEVDPKVRDILCGDDDFAAVIQGDFRSETLSVERAMIHREFLWRRHKEKGEWVRMGEEKRMTGNGTPKPMGIAVGRGRRI
jgi:hypothetical protein